MLTLNIDKIGRDVRNIPTILLIKMNFCILLSTISLVLCPEELVIKFLTDWGTRDERIGKK